MTIAPQRRLTRLARALRSPRRTIRLRLTVMYAGLFLTSGAILLTIGYRLVAHVLPDPAAHRVMLINGHAASAALRAEDARQRASVLHELLSDYLVTLGAMSLLSVVLGWLVAARALAPMRQITTTAQRISASNLHERLALSGPDDELKDLGDTIDDLLARLERSFQFQRRFVANASHELRTPLALQQALLEATLTDPQANPGSWRATCERVLATCQHQTRLINALLALARSEGQLNRDTPVDLAQLTDHALRARHADAERLGLNLASDLRPAATHGDPQLIDQLIANLLDNALRHNVDHGWIRATTRTTNGHAVVSISNTGPEVPKADIGRLLEPFQRLGADRTSQDQGVGLGLSIAHAITRAHQAELDVRPLSGGGLAVEVQFAQRAATSQPSEEPIHQQTTSEQSPGATALSSPVHQGRGAPITSITNDMTDRRTAVTDSSAGKATPLLPSGAAAPRV